MYSKLNNIKCFIFDLDGTLYIGDRLIAGANELITVIREQSKQILFVTNNSSKTRLQIVEKLKNMGFDVQLEEVINSCFATAKYLKDNKYSQIYCMGTKEFENEISDFGISSTSNTPEAIVIGYDPEFNYNKLEKAMSVFNQECQIIAVNEERSYPRANGIMAPGAGPAVKAFEHAVNKKTDLFIGKPSTFMLELITKKFNLLPCEMLVIGDTYETDILMAKSFGVASILISTDHCDKKNDECIVVKDLDTLKKIIEGSSNDKSI